MVTLTRPGGVSSAGASDINDAGVIVGTYTRTGVGFRAFVYQGGVFTELPPDPPGLWSMAWALNNAGQVVGYRSIGDGVNPLSAFVWSASDGFIDLGLMGEQETVSHDISDQGEVVGRRGFAAATDEAYLWEGGEATFLALIPGGSTSSAGGINKNRQVVGGGLLEDPKTGHVSSRAFFWENGVMALLAPLAGMDRCGASDLNDVGQVIGFCISSDNPNAPRPFLSQSGLTYDLNDLVEMGAGVTLQRARVINNTGQIVGDAQFNGFRVAFVLSPIGSPVGDISMDCEVDVDDLLLLLDHFGQVFSPADLNSDGVVNVLDLIILLLNFG